MTAEEIASKFPGAVLVAREFRDVFGPGVRLLYARNEHGEEMGKPLITGKTDKPVDGRTE